MKITSESQNLIVVKDSNYFSFIIGSIFTLSGILALIKTDLFTNTPPTWLVPIFIGVGFITIATAKVTTVSLGKTSNKMNVTKNSLLSRNISEYSLDQIKSIEIKTTHRYSFNRYQYFYNLVFNLGNDNPVVLNQTGSALSLLGRKQLKKSRKMGKQLAEFLGVNFIERTMPTTTEILSTISSAVSKTIEDEFKNKNS